MAADTTTWANDASGERTRASLWPSINRDVVVMIGVRIAIVAASGLSSVVTARCLTPSRRGEYFLVYTLAQTLAQFGNFGLHSSNTYFVARDKSITGALLANSLWLALGAGGVGTALIMLALKASGGAHAVEGLWTIAVLGPATLFYLLGANLLVGLKRLAAFNGFQLASNYVVLACLLAAAALGAGPAGFLTASAFGWLAVSCALLVTLRRETTTRSLAFRTDIFSVGFRYALKAYVATLCGFLVVRGNVFMLRALTSPEQVGYYSVASQVADVLGILPQSMALVLFPALITESAGRFRTTLKNVSLVAVLLAVGCGIVGLCAEPFVRVVFGEKFLGTVPILRWMLPSAFFLGLTSVLSQYLAASGFPISLVGVWMAGSVVAAALGRLLIPAGAGVGAAMALSAAHAGLFIAILGLSVIHARTGPNRESADLVVEGAIA